VFVASAEFRTAAAAQSASLGIQVEGVFVPHPIQDRTDDEMGVLARDALEAVIAAITA